MKKREQLLNRVFKIVPEVKEGLTKSLFISLVYEAVKLIPVILIKFLIDSVTEKSSSLSMILWIILGIFSVYLFSNFVDYFSDKWSHKQMLTYETSILKKSEKKLLELHMGYHEKHNTGLHVSRINKGASKLTELIWFVFNEFIPTIMQLVLTFILLIYEQWIIALVFIAFTLLIFLLADNTAKKVQPYRAIYHRKYEEAFGEMSQTLANIATVKDYAREKKEFCIYSSLLRGYFDASMLRMNFEMNRVLLRDVIINFGRVITLFIASYMVVQNGMTTGTLVLVYTLSEKAFLSVFRLGRIYTHVGDSIESIHRLSDLLDEEALVKDKDNPVEVKKLVGKIEFRNTSFEYTQNVPVLKNVNLLIKPKQIIALVGRSGGGKSSIII